MSGRSDASLAAEAARRRVELRDTRAALTDANRMLLGVFLRDRLADPADFDVYIGAGAVTDSRGRILWARVDLLLDELLKAKPHLAAPEGAVPLRRGVSAVDFFTAGT